MLRLAWIVGNSVAAVVMLTAFVFFVVPTEFEATNDSEAMRITWKNLLCKIPKPHLDIADEDVAEYWRLSRGVRLSPRMLDIGRCHLAVLDFNEMRSAMVYDLSICNCANEWCVPVVAFTALGLGLAMLIQCVGSFACKNGCSLTRIEMKAMAQWEVFRMIVFGVVSLICAMNCENDFVYTKYGQIYPTSYFESKPWQWRIGIQCFVGGNLGLTAISVIIFLVYKCCFRKSSAKKKSTSRKKCSSFLLNQARSVGTFNSFLGTPCSPPASHLSHDRVKSPSTSSSVSTVSIPICERAHYKSDSSTESLASAKDTKTEQGHQMGATVEAKKPRSKTVSFIDAETKTNGKVGDLDEGHENAPSM